MRAAHRINVRAGAAFQSRLEHSPSPRSCDRPPKIVAASDGRQKPDRKPGNGPGGMTVSRKGIPTRAAALFRARTSARSRASNGSRHPSRRGRPLCCWLRDGTIEMDAIVSGMLMTKIRQGNTATIFWYMCNGIGWKDTPTVEKRVNELEAIVRRGARGAQESQFAGRAVRATETYRSESKGGGPPAASNVA